MSRAESKARFEEWAADPLSVDVLTQRIAEGETLTAVCTSRQIPYALTAQWIAEDAERLRRYEAALSLWADAEAQRCLAIADGATPEDVAAAKLRITTRLSLAGKWDRRRYGEHTKVEHSGSVSSLIQVLSSLPRDVTPQPAALAAPALTQPIDATPVIVPQPVSRTAQQPVVAHEEI